MTKIMQGDQYKIPFTIKFTGNGETTVITPNNCTDVCAVLGNRLLYYSDSDLLWNSEAEVWEYPLSAEQSEAMAGTVEMQFAVKMLDDIFYSENYDVNVSRSIIKEAWR